MTLESFGPLPSAHSVRKEVDLVCWVSSAHTTLPGSEIDVLGSHRAGHREVLEDGGEEEEQFVASDAFTKTNALPCGHRGSPCGHGASARACPPHPKA